MSKKSKAFSFILVFLTLAITLVLADLLSSFLTVGNFAFLQTQAAKSAAYKIYAVSLEKNTVYDELSVYAQSIKLKGGAGYIYQSSGTYYVLASAYENQNDAKKVLNNIVDYPRQEIIELSIAEIVLDITLNSTEKTTLNNALNSFKNAYKKLYDLSVSLDTGVKTFNESRLLATEILNEVNATKTAFDNLFLNKLTNEVFKIKLKLNEELLTVRALIENEIDQQVIYSSKLKETYIKIVLLNKELAKELVS